MKIQWIHCFLVLIKFASKINIVLIKNYQIEKASDIYKIVIEYETLYNELLYRKEYVEQYINLIINLNRIEETINFLIQETEFLKENDSDNINCINRYYLNIILLMFCNENNSNKLDIKKIFEFY